MLASSLPKMRVLQQREGAPLLACLHDKNASARPAERKNVIEELEKVKLTLVQWPEEPRMGDDVFLKASRLPCRLRRLLEMLQRGKRCKPRPSFWARNGGLRLTNSLALTACLAGRANSIAIRYRAAHRCQSRPQVSAPLSRLMDEAERRAINMQLAKKQDTYESFKKELYNQDGSFYKHKACPQRK